MSTNLDHVMIPIAEHRLDVSLRFYQQVLGMSIFKQVETESEAQGALLGLPGSARTRLTLLRSGDSSEGMIGLLEYLQPDLQVMPFEKKSNLPYPVYLVHSAQNIGEIYARALACGTNVPKPPRAGEIPGKGMARDWGCIDPNGVYVELLEYPLRDDSAPSVLPLRRVSLAVARGNMPASRRFYSELVQMQVLLDHEASGKGEGSPLGVGDWKMHGLYFQQPGSMIGTVGLMEYLEPQMDVRPLTRPANGPYPISLAFRADNVAETYARAIELAVPVVCPPLNHSRPLEGTETQMSCVDPNGALVLFTQVQQE